jgi:hypothetical protein
MNRRQMLTRRTCFAAHASPFDDLQRLAPDVEKSGRRISDGGI